MPRSSSQIGKIGENIALNYLHNKNYKIIDRNIRFRNGELDIVSIQNLGDEKILVFVEVKTRISDSLENSFESIGKKKIDFLKRSAYLYIQDKPSLPKSLRIDAISIVLDSDLKYPKVDHVENIT